MTERFTVTRRRVLAGLGATGLAASGAGLGTSALLNDTETFEGNSLTAGTLDMKLDWTEHYYNDSNAEARVVDSLTAADVFLPAPAGLDGAKSIMLAYDDVGTFMADTSIEAFPDVTPTQAGSDQPPYDGVQSMPTGVDPCAFLESADAALDSPLRTRGTVNGETTDAGDPLVMLDDVKPGDFGEVTFSFHLCDNPGYVWIQGALAEANENGTNEPEAVDPDESGPTDESSTTLENDVELLDAIQTRFWYDDYEGDGSAAGNNILDRNGGGDVDVMLAIDTSGSISQSEMASLTAGVNEFVGAFPNDGRVQVGALTFGNGGVSNFNPLDSVGNFSAGAVLPNRGRGNTPLPPAMDIADNELHNGTNARAGAEKILVLFSDGGPNYENKTYSANGYTAPRTNDWTLDTSGSAPGYDGGTTGDAAVTKSEQDEAAAVAAKVKANGTKILAIDVGEDPSDDIDHTTGAQNHDIFLKYRVVSSPIQNYYRNVAIDDLQMAAMNLVASVVNAEEVFFRGSLREALEVLSDDDGIPLDGDLSTPYYELGESPASANRECFAGGTTHHIAFQWWLPIDHANEIQSDSVAFDIGFYTEQCRHHNGTTAEV